MAQTRFDILSRGLRRKRGEMNKTEEAYAARLDVDPAVFRWWFEPLSLWLSHPKEGNPATFKPDFLVLYKDGTTCIDDVKSGGRGFDDKAAGVRIKAAAELYPLWRFRLVRKQLKRDGGGFVVVEV